MIVMAATRVAVIRGSHIQRLVKPERQYRFGGHSYSATSCEHLGACSAGCARGGSYSSTFAASSDRSNDGAQHCAAAYVFRGALIFADALLTPGPRDVIALNHVTPPIHIHRFEVERQIASADVPDNQLRVRAPGNSNVSIGIDHVAVHHPAVDPAITGISYIN